MEIQQGPTQLPAPAVCLVILDGWGLAPPGPGNAVAQANTPTFDYLVSNYPNTTLTAGGLSVGLPEGQMGNSEVGHLNLGAGAVIKQDLTRIDESAAAGSLADNDVIRASFTRSQRLHLIGLVSDGGVHSSLQHLKALIDAAKQLEVKELIVHVFTDGRDTLPSSAAGYIQQLQQWLDQLPAARIGSIIGRYYGMDRDSRWERVQSAYDLIVKAEAPFRYETAAEAVEHAYSSGKTDEFIEPTVIGNDTAIRPEDSVFCFNFRPDRVRELTQALCDPDFKQIERSGHQVVTNYATMTEYDERWNYPVAFLPERPQITLAEVIAANGGAQLHVAETEKYPHVTYFFNGGQEQPQSLETRSLIPSPRDVPTYDYKPEMSALQVAEAFVEGWQRIKPQFAVINFANPDMVGHTGVIPAAVTAIETVDSCLQQVVNTVHSSGGVCIVTADHGNAEQMLEPDGSPNTAHSLNPVPLIVTSTAVGATQPGILADVAPTALKLLGIKQPQEMTGRPLI